MLLHIFSVVLSVLLKLYWKVHTLYFCNVCCQSCERLSYCVSDEFFKVVKAKVKTILRQIHRQKIPQRLRPLHQHPHLLRARHDLPQLCHCHRAGARFNMYLWTACTIFQKHLSEGSLLSLLQKYSVTLMLLATI